MNAAATALLRTLRRTGRRVLVFEGGFVVAMLVCVRLPVPELFVLMTQLPAILLFQLLPKWVWQLAWISKPPDDVFAGWTSAGLLALVVVNGVVLTLVISAAVIGIRAMRMASSALLRQLDGLGPRLLDAFRPRGREALVQGLLASRRDLPP